MDWGHRRWYTDNGNKRVEKVVWGKGWNGRESLRRLKPTVGCNGSKRRRRKDTFGCRFSVVILMNLMRAGAFCYTVSTLEGTPGFRLWVRYLIWLILGSLTILVQMTWLYEAGWNEQSSWMLKCFDFENRRLWPALGEIAQHSVDKNTVFGTTCRWVENRQFKCCCCCCCCCSCRRLCLPSLLLCHSIFVFLHSDY